MWLFTNWNRLDFTISCNLSIFVICTNWLNEKYFFVKCMQKGGLKNESTILEKGTRAKQIGSAKIDWANSFEWDSLPRTNLQLCEQPERLTHIAHQRSVTNMKKGQITCITYLLNQLRWIYIRALLAPIFIDFAFVYSLGKYIGRIRTTLY